MPFHLNVRVPWHDARWDGTVCRAPRRNSFCLDLDNIRDRRDDAVEEELAGRHFSDLEPAQLPPCSSESGAFMSPREWWQVRAHPYAGLQKAKATHGHLLPTRIRMPAYSTLAVPFWWMLRQNQELVDARVAEPLPPDEDPPFDSAWVFGRARQEAIGDLFFNRLAAGSSLIVFYTKSGHPLDDDINRLVVGIGRLDKIGPMLRYDAESGPTYPLWERSIEHSIRPDGTDGFLVPYHDYLQPTGDPDEDRRRQELVREIMVVPERANIAAYSYAGELANSDITLSTCVRTLEAIRLVQSHGIAPGPWSQREEWLNEQMSALWRDRGAFPGTGAALEALGLRLGTAMVYDLMAAGRLTPDADPWPLLGAILRGDEAPPKTAYAADVKAAAPTWVGLSEQRRSLLQLLSRFALTPEQARRWFDPARRARAMRGKVDDAGILANPYRIAECDLGDANEQSITVGTLDRGLRPDATVAAAHPVPEPSHVGSAADSRRVRAGLVSVLRRAATEGDALLARDEALHRLSTLDLEQPLDLPPDWINGHAEDLDEEVKLLDVHAAGPDQPGVPSIQLAEHHSTEQSLRSRLRKRAAKPLPSPDVDWVSLLREAISDTSTGPAETDARHDLALQEQADALERITTRRLGVLVGRAGTGKTTVLSALLRAPSLADEGVLFLAPTGKASVQIAAKSSHAEVRTVAAFLYHLGRYDGVRQRPLLDTGDKYHGARTVVVDESSMLTEEHLHALLEALDLAHVKRLILVGDPNQLPPIGVGRPFADLVAFLDDAAERGDTVSGALARLTTELRTRSGGEASDALRLAAWYTREPQPVDADAVLEGLELGGHFNDLDVRVWQTTEELREQIDELFVSELRMDGTDDVQGFNRALGLTPEGWVPFGDHGGAERFQLLSPVRQHSHGVHDLNRVIQHRYRQMQLRKAAGRGGVALGDEQIVWGDKVMLLNNGVRKGYDFGERQQIENYLANGEVGFAAKPKTGGRYLDARFARREGRSYRFFPGQFAGGTGPLSLAYALTIHKAQGSEFGTVFVILPRHTRLLARELIYTAITRARDKVVLLVEGDVAMLYELTQAGRSDTARRNTNLFTGAVRTEAAGVPYAEHLIHRTTNGVLVRSKSELVIANHLESIGLDYHYERPLEGAGTGGHRRPDFSFIDDAGDVVVWEHLGMLDRPDYRASWERKRAWYDANGYAEGIDLFTTQDRDGGLDSADIIKVAEQVREAME